MATETQYSILRDMIAEDATAFPNDKLDRYLSMVTYTDSDGLLAYDLHRAAALIWADKAAAIARRAFNVQVDATRADRASLMANYRSMSRYHARLSNAGSVRFVPAGSTVVSEDV